MYVKMLRQQEMFSGQVFIFDTNISFMYESVCTIIYNLIYGLMVNEAFQRVWTEHIVVWNIAFWWDWKRQQNYWLFFKRANVKKNWFFWLETYYKNLIF